MNAIYVFTLRDVPVFVSPWYFLLIGYYVLMASGGGLVMGLLVAACVTVSLLVHEFGHALTARHFGLQPAVVLHGWGGLCAHQPAKRDRDEALVVAAGPAAGLVFGLLAVAIWLGLSAIAPEFLTARPYLATALWWLVFVNIFWTFFNILPLWPLDGGQLMGIGARQFAKRPRAERFMHIVSLVTVSGLILAGISMGMGIMLIILGFLAWENVQRLRTTAAAPRKTSNFVGELLREAEAKLAAGDAAEAARLCHLARADGRVSDRDLGAVWELLAVSTLNVGKLEEGLRFAARGDPSRRLVEARIVAMVALGQLDDARELLAKSGDVLPADVRSGLAEGLHEPPTE